MEAKVKKTGEIINVYWEKNPKGEGGHYVDRNGYHEFIPAEELEFSTKEYGTNFHV